MEIKYDETEWNIVARTDNFIVFCGKQLIVNVRCEKTLILCEELLRHGYIPDFSDIDNNVIYFRKLK